MILKWRDNPSEAFGIDFSLSPKSFNLLSYGYDARIRELTIGMYIVRDFILSIIQFLLDYYVCTLTDTKMLTSYDTACQWLQLKMPGVFTALPSQRSRHRTRQRLYHCAAAGVMPGVFT
jgi:hypothetical protein